MWNKYKCHELDIEKNDEKYIKLIGNILNNKFVSIIMKIILTMISTVTAVAGTGGSLLLELTKIFKPKELKDKNGNGEMQNTSIYFDMFISIMKLTEVSTSTILNVNKQIVEKNPNSSFIDSILKIKFTGNFEDFEKDCDTIFAKETYDYTADELTILYLTMIDALDQYTVSNTKGKMAGNYDIDEALGFNFLRDASKGIAENTKNVKYYKLDEKDGNYVLDMKNETVKEKMGSILDMWEKMKTMKNEKKDAMRKRIIYSYLEKIQRPGFYPNDVSKDSIYNESEILMNQFVRYANSLLNYNKKFKLDSDEGNKIFAYLINIVETPVDNPQNTDEFYEKFKDLTINFIEEKIDECFVKDSDYIIALENMSFSQYSNLARDFVFRELEKTPESETRDLNLKRTSQAVRFAEIGVFLTITKQYDAIKYTMSHLVPTRLLTLLFDSNSNFYLSEEILAFIAGTILGPEYLAENTDNSVNRIIKDYIEIETEQVDPFVTKYMLDQKFIKNKEEKKDDFNIFISNAEIADVKNAQRDSVKEKADAAVRGGNGIDKAKNNIDEEGINEKLEYLVSSDKLTKSAKLIKDSVDPRLLGVIIKEIEVHEAAIDESDPKDVAIIAGLLSGNVLSNNLNNMAKSRIHKILCYLSTNLRSITNLRSQISNIVLAFLYLSSKLNNKVYENYKTWAKNASGAPTLQKFSKAMRRSQQKNAIEIFLN